MYRASSRFGADIDCTIGDLNADEYNDVAVGAPGYEQPQADSGAVFLLVMNNNDFAASLRVLDRKSGGAFEDLPTSWTGLGESLAALPPRNRSSGAIVDLVVGMPTSNGIAIATLGLNGVSVGGLEVISDGQNGIPSGTILPGAQFGQVSAAGDLDNDGNFDLAVAALGEDFDAGAIYLLYLNPSSQSSVVRSFDRLTKATPGLGGWRQLMSHIAIVDDINGDGRRDLVTGHAGAAPPHMSTAFG